MSEFLLGINYWPRRSAMYMWNRFDLGEVREDFARIRELGLHVVRFFIMWSAFEPQRGTMDRAMLQRFDAMMDTIASAGLRAMPTFFTGHMSGINYLPEWSLDRTRPHGRFRTFTHGLQSAPWGVGNFYSGSLFEAARVHVRSVAERCRDHPGVYLWDLGNEFSNLRSADSPQESAAWSRRLTEDLIDASGTGATAGNHGEDLTEDRGFRPSSFCEPFPCGVMHGYPVYMALARSRTDPELIPFLCQLWQSMSGKPVLFNEFGNPTCPPGMISPYDREALPGEPPSKRSNAKNAAPYACLTEEEMAAYCTAVLDRLQRRGAIGAFWWNWADYAQNLEKIPPFDRARHELHFGIIRNDTSYKPVAFALQRFARERRHTVPLPPPIVHEDEWYAHTNTPYQKAVYRRYLRSYERSA